MAKEANKDIASEFDAIDLQIIALRRDNPRIPIREISAHVKLGSNAVWKRLRRIGESDFVKLCRAELADMLPLAQRAYLRSLRNPDKQLEAATKLFTGLGVFTSRNEHSGPDGGPIKVAGPVFILPENESISKPDDADSS